MAFVDFTTFTEVDPASDISSTASRMTFSTMQCRVVNAYAYKDYGAGYLNSNFEHRFSFNITANPNGTNSQQVCYLWCWTNTPASSKGFADSAIPYISFFPYEFTGFGGQVFILQEKRTGGTNTVNNPTSFLYFSQIQVHY